MSPRKRVMQISKTSWLMGALFGLSCDVTDLDRALFSVRVENKSDCTLDPNICQSQGLVCDKVTHQCTAAVSGSCMSPAMCPSPLAASCVSGMCVPCSADNACEAWSVANSSPQILHSCMAPGTCVECSNRAHCTDVNRPICDTVTNRCTCLINSDCSSGICDKPNGQCVASDQIVYVDNRVCPSMGNGSQATPYCTVASALASNKPYISVAGSTKSYGSIAISTGNIVIIGAGRDSSTPTRFDSVTVSGGILSISSVQIVAASKDPAVTCNGFSSLYLRDSIVSNNTGRGIDAEGCGIFYTDRSRVTSAYSGIRVGSVSGKSTTTFRISNTAVVASGNVIAEPYGVVLNNNAQGFFGFNTLTGNQGGINCSAMSPQNISDSIIAGNSPPAVTSCSSARIIQSGVDLEVGMEPKLKDTANNSACCIDKGLLTAPEIVPTDYYGIPRPQGFGYDIGFHELK